MKMLLESSSIFLGETVTHMGSHLVEATILPGRDSLRRRWMRTSKQWLTFVVPALEGSALKQVPQSLSRILYTLLGLPSLSYDSLSSFPSTSPPWSATCNKMSFRDFFLHVCFSLGHPNSIQSRLTWGLDASSFLAGLPESHGDWRQCYSRNYEIK